MQRFIAIYLSVVLGLSACQYAVEVSQPRPPVTDQDLADATRLVTILFEGQAMGSGTAWLVANNTKGGVYATAGHVCEAGMQYSLTNQAGTEELGVTTLGDDDVNDVCLLQAGPAFATPLELSYVPPVYGEVLRYVGAPAGLFGGGMAPLFYGRYMGTHGEFLGAAIPGYPGASGSAVVNTKGEVIGILVRVLNAWKEESFLTPIGNLRKLLLANGL